MSRLRSIIPRPQGIIASARQVVGGVWQSVTDQARDSQSGERARGAHLVPGPAARPRDGGAAGTLYSHYEGLIAPHMFAVHESIAPYVMMIIGGLGNIYGGVAGSVIMTVAPEYLRAVAEYRMVTYGALIVVLVILMPEGIGAAVLRIARILREIFSGREKLVENP